MSTKKEELEKIINAMNIQIDNPISVLNQDVSRSFLVTASPSDKYNLFMKATRLETINNNYKEAYQLNEDSRRRLKANEEVCILCIFSSINTVLYILILIFVISL